MPSEEFYLMLKSVALSEYFPMHSRGKFQVRYPILSSSANTEITFHQNGNKINVFDNAK